MAIILGMIDADILSGTEESDEIFGFEGDDTILGSRGADQIDGGADLDTVDYSAAGAWVYVDLERGAGYSGDANGDTYAYIESITGSDFNDILVGSSTLAGTISGGLGNDYLRNSGADGTVLDGGAGNDWLASYGGDTTFIGGTGDDTLTGASGVDEFHFNLGDGSDDLRNFQNGTDVIAFEIAGLTFGDLVIADTTDGATISYGVGDTILVRGVGASLLDADDFIFV